MMMTASQAVVTKTGTSNFLICLAPRMSNVTLMPIASVNTGLNYKLVV